MLDLAGVLVQAVAELPVLLWGDLTLVVFAEVVKFLVAHDRASETIGLVGFNDSVLEVLECFHFAAPCSRCGKEE